mgnify:CR=1 FL=1
MRTIQSLFFFVALTLAACVPDDKSGPNPTETTVTIPTQGATSPTSYPNMSLFWADEFTGSELSDNYWSHETGNGSNGWGNNELQFYRPQNTSTKDGHLIITAKKEPFGGKEYTSSRIVTKVKKEFRYGRVDIRAALPKGQGIWPALWMLASQTTFGSTYWPDQGEIDIMEHVGYDPSVVHASVHTNLFNHVLRTQQSAKTIVPTFNTVFHVYRMDWTPDEIKVFLDDKEFFVFKRQGALWQEWPFSQPQHLLINIAVGGNWGGLKGIDDAIFPIKLEVDYVRYYSLKQ